MDKRTQEITSHLLSFGLTKKEASVYLSTLELGRTTVSKISRKANINRTTGYDILDSLINKGLISISGKEPKQEYVAESPDNILMLLEKQLQTAQENIKRAKNFVPELKSIQKIGDRPQVKFYEGVEGMKQVCEDTLTAKKPIYAYANYDDMHRTMGDYFPSYYQRRAKKGISVMGIVPDSPLARERASKNKEEARELAVVPANVFSISPDIEIYDNKVTILSWREKLGIIIESAEIADAMKKIFELAWAEAKRLDKQSGLGVKSEAGV